MPCNSEYMAQTPEERRAQKTAQLVLFVSRRANLPLTQKEKKDFNRQANEYYAEHVGQTEALCTMTKILRESGELILAAASPEASTRLCEPMHACCCSTPTAWHRATR